MGQERSTTLPPVFQDNIRKTTSADFANYGLILFSVCFVESALKHVAAQCVKELILDGKNVKLDDLAIFSVGIVSEKGAESAEAFKVSENIKGLKLRARATGELSNSRINLTHTCHLKIGTQYGKF